MLLAVYAPFSKYLVELIWSSLRNQGRRRILIFIPPLLIIFPLYVRFDPETHQRYRPWGTKLCTHTSICGWKTWSLSKQRPPLLSSMVSSACQSTWNVYHFSLILNLLIFNLPSHVSNIAVSGSILKGCFGMCDKCRGFYACTLFLQDLRGWVFYLWFRIFLQHKGLCITFYQKKLPKPHNFSPLSPQSFFFVSFLLLPGHIISNNPLQIPPVANSVQYLSRTNRSCRGATKQLHSSNHNTFRYNCFLWFINFDFDLIDRLKTFPTSTIYVVTQSMHICLPIGFPPVKSVIVSHFVFDFSLFSEHFAISMSGIQIMPDNDSMVQMHIESVLNSIRVWFF